MSGVVVRGVPSFSHLEHKRWVCGGCCLIDMSPLNSTLCCMSILVHEVLFEMKTRHFHEWTGEQRLDKRDNEKRPDD